MNALRTIPVSLHTLPADDRPSLFGVD